ncbi:MAG: PKD domain-containing protein, partial [Armatimonadota bacterium]
MPGRISRIATVTVALLVVLADVSASTLTVKVVHPRTDPYQTPANRFVTFCAAAFDSTGQDVSAQCVFTWDFGDGEKAEANPTAHQYQPGEYKVIVTAALEDLSGEAGLTVIVGEPAPPAAGGRAAFLRIAPPEMPAPKVCDQPVVECVQTLPAPNAVWCNLYYQPPGATQFTGHSGGEALNVEGGGVKYYWIADWHSCVDHNFNVADAQWYGEVFLDWEQDPVITPVLTRGIDNTIIKAEDDCGAQYAGVLAYDPQGEPPTISWTLSHLNFHTVNDPDPPFNVRLKIYKLDGTL